MAVKSKLLNPDYSAKLDGSSQLVFSGPYKSSNTDYIDIPYTVISQYSRDTVLVLLSPNNDAVGVALLLHVSNTGGVVNNFVFTTSGATWNYTTSIVTVDGETFLRIDGTGNWAAATAISVEGRIRK